MDRREFLKGVVAMPIAAALPMSVPMTTGVVAIPSLAIFEAAMDRLSQKIVHTIIYGNDEYMPTQFIGFRQFVDAPDGP